MQHHVWLMRARFLTLRSPILLLSIIISSCSLAEEPTTTPQLPTQNSLVTESSTTSSLLAPSTEETTVRGQKTYQTILNEAAKVNVSHYHNGATSEEASATDTPDYHFSTQSGDVRCSTETGATLVCSVPNRGYPDVPKPDDASENCDWKSDLVLLDSTGPTQGGCANEVATVLFNSQKLPYGKALSVGTITCLSDISALYCLDSISNRGLEIGSNIYHEFSGTENAPRILQTG